VTLARPLPRFVEVRRLARGSAAFYFRIPTHYRKLGCEMANEPLGTSYEAACRGEGKGGRAATLNGCSMNGTMQELGTAAVHLLPMATPYTNAQKE